MDMQVEAASPPCNPRLRIARGSFQSEDLLFRAPAFVRVHSLFADFVYGPTPSAPV
jgi:hypothetical protein